MRIRHSLSSDADADGDADLPLPAQEHIAAKEAAKVVLGKDAEPRPVEVPASVPSVNVPVDVSHALHSEYDGSGNFGARIKPETPEELRETRKLLFGDEDDRPVQHLPVLHEPRERVARRSRVDAIATPEVSQGRAAAQARARETAHAERASRKAARGRWAVRNKKAEAVQPATIGEEAAAVDRVADSEAASAGKARRLALQAVTTPAHRDRERGHWDQAIADYEPAPRTIIAGTWEVVAGPADGRSQWVSMYPDREELTPETSQQLARRLAAGRSPRIKSQHAVAHFVISWRDDPTLAEAVTTARRLCGRLGIDPEQQQIGAAMHSDGAACHLHLLVARTRTDGGVWKAGIGVDRALALESRLMALERGGAWDQRMIARSRTSGAALGFMRAGKLEASILYDGTQRRLAWQGAAVTDRIADDIWARARTGGECIAKMVGLRSAQGTARYVLSH